VKAFLKGIVALVIISVVAAVGLGMMPMSAQDVFTESQNVRL